VGKLVLAAQTAVTVGLGAVFPSGPLSAQDGLVLYRGGTCATWVEARESNASDGAEHYVIGFITGVQLSRTLDFWVVDGNRIEPEEVFQWLDDHCRSHARDGMYLAIHKLIGERLGRGPFR
jgi:hypothetical protein